jgi:hypothetical protein
VGGIGMLVVGDVGVGGVGVGVGSLFLLHEAMLKTIVRANSKFLDLIRKGLNRVMVRDLVDF